MLVFVFAVAACEKGATDETPKESTPETIVEKAKPIEPKVDADPCETAYDDLSKTLQALRETAPSDEGTDAPDRAEYLELCATVPEPAQKCLVLAYVHDNLEACKRVEEGLDEKTSQTYQKLLSGQ